MKLAYRIDGPESAPVLVLSCSIGTTWELWNAQLPALERDFRVLRYDHPGHGRSPVAGEPLTVEALAAGVVGLLDELGIERPSVCGVSLGGMVGMALARDCPERVDRLVVCCTAAYLGPAERWHERARIVREAGTSAIARKVLGLWFTERFLEEEHDTVAGFREMLESVPREGYAACCDAIAGWDARESLGAIRRPTLVIAGAEDTATPPTEGARLAEAIPQAELAVLPGAAHLANVEQPEPFTRALLEYLSLTTSEVVG